MTFRSLFVLVLLAGCSGGSNGSDDTDDTTSADTDVADTDAFDTDVADTDLADTDAADTDVAPNDVDGDGVTDAADNCGATWNPTQADADSDGKGDACDVCPNASNPGTQGCPVTVYDVKSGVASVGDAVRLSDVLVTAVAPQGFFVQVKPGDLDYLGDNFSGLYVVPSAFYGAGATVGSRVSFDGVVDDQSGAVGVGDLTSFVTTAVGPEALPLPITVTAAEVQTGGTRAVPLEGVLVKLSGVAQVTAVDSVGLGFTATDTTGAVEVGALLYSYAPPVFGLTYADLGGVLALRAGVSTILPRDGTDLILSGP